MKKLDTHFKTGLQYNEFSNPVHFIEQDCDLPVMNFFTKKK